MKKLQSAHVADIQQMEEDQLSNKQKMMEEFEKILADQEREQKEVENELRA